MGLPRWEVFSDELAGPSPENASRRLANADLSDEEKLQAPRHLAGFSWSQETMGKVSAP